LFARPADDLLPQPEACLVTGITPQQAANEGVPEAELAMAVHRELAQPGTCGAGYNSLRFDDEVTRYLFYRNLLDPYAHTYRDGNSRWDLIDALRLAHALRPDGIEWPEHEPGVASFRLEHLTAANGIPHVGAHDALADVRATIALAGLLRHAQPRLFDYTLSLRATENVRRLLAKDEPLLHCSQRYPAALGCIAPVAAVGTDPANPKRILCFDLRQDPGLLLDLDVDQIRERLFTATAELPEGVERLGIKGVKVNASPVLAPLGTVDDAAAARWRIDVGQVRTHAQRLRAVRAEVARKLADVYRRDRDERGQVAPRDPDLMLYDGFFPDEDRRTMERLRGLSPQELAAATPRFLDPRLPTLLFRMRARSWPETLSESERVDWNAWRRERLSDPGLGGSMTVEALAGRIAELRVEHAADERGLEVLDALERWADQLMDRAPSAGTIRASGADRTGPAPG
jgi:exodeoxyribonuclease-1